MWLCPSRDEDDFIVALLPWHLKSHMVEFRRADGFLLLEFTRLCCEEPRKLRSRRHRTAADTADFESFVDYVVDRDPRLAIKPPCKGVWPYFFDGISPASKERSMREVRSDQAGHRKHIPAT